VRRSIAFVTLLLASEAHADHTSVHVTASGDVAVTDNVFSVPRDSNPESDAYTQVRPGVLFTWETPRMIQVLEADAEVLEYATHNNTDPSFTLAGRWEALFLPTPRSQLGLGADASNGHLNALTARNTPDQTSVNVVPAGSAEVRNADATEFLSWQATKETRTNQQAYVRWAATNDDAVMPTTTDSVEVGLGLGFDRTFTRDDFGLQVGGSALRLERIAPAGSTAGSRLDQQLNPTATGSWRHDYTKHWSTSLSAGLVYVNPYGTDPHNPMAMDRRAAAYPVYGGTLAYTDVWGGATLTAARGVSPNLYIAQNTVSDGVTAKILLPMPWLDSRPRNGDPLFTALGSLGVERTQLVDPDTSDLQGSFQLARADIGLQWQPRASVKYTLRYEFVYQHGDAIASAITPSYYRNSLFFEFAFRYPEIVATQVPRTNGSVRADGGDLAPVGAEPVVPDAAAPAPSE
jgi:hypothetical protein